MGSTGPSEPPPTSPSAAESADARAVRKAEKRERKQRARKLQARLVFGALALVRWTPRWLWNGALAPLAALFVPRLLRQRADEQLRLAFGERFDARARRGIVRRMLRHHARTLREVALYRRADAAFVGRMIEAEPEFAPRVRELLAKGRGLVVVTPHYGNFELMPAWFKHFLGAHGGVVGKRNVNPWFDAEMVAMRARHGVETIYQDESPRKLLRILSSGGIVGILPDQDIVRLPGIFVDFFGRPAWTTTGPAHLSMLADAPLVPAYLEWNGARYRLRLAEPLFPDRSAPRDAEIERLTKGWTRSFEAAIAAQPDHWIWFHARWRTTRERAEKRRSEGRVRHTRTSS
ncbi:MAG: lysophospholipid acyltransferase family protein [Planctomycetes bacterium]|nr:lysophospholipid acyltransferase family protein [Planctomycetota bacterium]